MTSTFSLPFVYTMSPAVYRLSTSCDFVSPNYLQNVHVIGLWSGCPQGAARTAQHFVLKAPKGEFHSAYDVVH